MSIISSTRSNKADSSQLVKPNSAVAEVGSSEGSLLEEFSQILDKIADQLARGYKPAESIDLLAVEQTAQRVQAQVSAQVQRPVEPESRVDTEVGTPVDCDERKETPVLKEQGENQELQISNDNEGGVRLSSENRDGSADEGSLESFAETVVEAAPERSGDLPRENTEEAVVAPLVTEEVTTPSIEGEVAVTLNSASELAPVDVQTAPVVTGEEAPIAPELASGVAVGGSERVVDAARVKSGEMSHATTTVGSAAVPANVNGAASSNAIAGDVEQQIARPTVNAVARPEALSVESASKSMPVEKAIPFSAFMLQGNGFGGGAVSRDVVAQSILRPGIDGVVGRHSQDIGAAAKGGNQSGMGGFNGDASLMRGAAGQAKNEGSAKALRSLPRAVAARTLEKVERALEEIARSKDGKTISLNLEPVNLGRVKVDVSLRDGNLHARLSAESTEVQQLLREHAHELHTILRKIGLHVDTVSVSVSADGGSFENTADLYERDQSSRRSEDREDANVLSTPAAVVESGRPAVADDHWVA